MSPAIQLPQVVNQVFNDIDEMATAALEWDQEYEQIGCGRFRGELTQLVLDQIQLNREQWTPGVLQSGPAPKNSWVLLCRSKRRARCMSAGVRSSEANYSPARPVTTSVSRRPGPPIS
jgi:hypothetical protein